MPTAVSILLARTGIYVLGGLLLFMQEQQELHSIAQEHKARAVLGSSEAREDSLPQANRGSMLPRSWWSRRDVANWVRSIWV